MNRTLFAKELRSSLPVTGIIAAVLTMYVIMVVSMFDPELGESLDMMMQSMPEVFAAFGMSTQGSTLLEFMLNYLYGFLLTVLPLVLVLIMVNRLMVRYLDRGTMAYLLATPNSRTRIALTLAGVLVCVLVLLMAFTTALEVGSAAALFPDELEVEGLLRANAGLFGLWLFMAGLCFASACVFKSSGAALWAGGGALIVAYLVQMAAQVGDKFEFLKNVNPLTLYDAYGLAANDSGAAVGAVVLVVLGVALFAAGITVFDRRDLSV